MHAYSGLLYISEFPVQFVSIAFFFKNSLASNRRINSLKVTFQDFSMKCNYFWNITPCSSVGSTIMSALAPVFGGGARGRRRPPAPVSRILHDIEMKRGEEERW